MKYDPEKNQEFYKFIESNGVLDILKGYTPSLSPTGHTLALCDKFIKLRETTFVQNVGLLFLSNGPWYIYSRSFANEIKMNILTIDAMIADYDKKLGLPTVSSSNWSQGRRLLSMGGIIPSNMLTGDVSVSKAPHEAMVFSMDLEMMFP